MRRASGAGRARRPGVHNRDGHGRSLPARHEKTRGPRPSGMHNQRISQQKSVSPGIHVALEHHADGTARKRSHLAPVCRSCRAGTPKNSAGPGRNGRQARHRAQEIARIVNALRASGGAKQHGECQSVRGISSGAGQCVSPRSWTRRGTFMSPENTGVTTTRPGSCRAGTLGLRPRTAGGRQVRRRQNSRTNGVVRPVPVIS